MVTEHMWHRPLRNLPAVVECPVTLSFVSLLFTQSPSPNTQPPTTGSTGSHDWPIEWPQHLFQWGTIGLLLWGIPSIYAIAFVPYFSRHVGYGSVGRRPWGTTTHSPFRPSEILEYDVRGIRETSLGGRKVFIRHLDRNGGTQ